MGDATFIDDINELALQTAAEPALDAIATRAPEVERRFSRRATTSPGFAFLAEHGARAVQAFKLLEIAQSAIFEHSETADINIAEWRLLQNVFDAEFLDSASRAYVDCKSQTREFESLTDIDVRAARRLSELVHLFENVMIYGRHQGILVDEQAPIVLRVLVRDFGEYFGLLVDDLDESKGDTVARLARHLVAFRSSEHFVEQLTLDIMTRLPLSDVHAEQLLDFEIARGIASHPIGVKELDVRCDADGKLTKSDAVALNTHRHEVVYARDLDADGVAVINAILPVFAVSAFEGLPSIAAAEAHIERRKREITVEEQQCFALLECLEHYDGQVPAQQREFRVSDVMKAAERIYRGKDKARHPKRVTSLGGMIRETMTGALKAITSTVSFEWPENRTMYRIEGYPESVAFFPLNISVRAGHESETYLFLCHVDTEVDPDADVPLIFEYQTVIGDGLLFDAYAAARNRFANAPSTFKRTLDLGPTVLFAKTVVHPGEREAHVDMEEVSLLGTVAALNGGMRSWMGQHYLMSDTGANAFINFPDVRDYVTRLD